MYRNNTNPKIINSDIIKETLIFEDNNRPEKKNYSINISYDIFIQHWNGIKGNQKEIISQTPKKI